MVGRLNPISYNWIILCSLMEFVFFFFSVLKKEKTQTTRTGTKKQLEKKPLPKGTRNPFGGSKLAKDKEAAIWADLLGTK